jgi:hypothetical protein
MPDADALLSPQLAFERLSKMRAARQEQFCSCEPSADDLDVTARLVHAGKILGIEVADHVIVAEGGFTSLREAGFIT